MDRISFLNTYIDNLTMAEAVEEAQHLIEKRKIRILSLQIWIILLFGKGQRICRNIRKC